MACSMGFTNTIERPRVLARTEFSELPPNVKAYMPTSDEDIILAVRKAIAERLTFCPELSDLNIEEGITGVVFHYDTRGPNDIASYDFQAARLTTVEWVKRAWSCGERYMYLYIVPWEQTPSLLAAHPCWARQPLMAFLHWMTGMGSVYI